MIPAQSPLIYNEDEGFKEEEAMVAVVDGKAKGDHSRVLGVGKKATEHLSAQILTCKIEIKEERPE